LLWTGLGCYGLRVAKETRPKAKLDLTDNEGTVLSLVHRIQPTTTYQIWRIYEASPVSSFNTSKGKVYPLIDRLVARKLLASEKVETDGRGTERLSCTALGEQALRRWVGEIKPSHLLLEDPLRTKVQSFYLLSRDEQIDWITGAKEQLADRLDLLDEYGRSVTVPYLDFVHDNAVRATRARVAWLDRMLTTLLRERSAEGKAASAS
jgi:DNA-binding PadR family transcriptional regulator